MKFLPMNFVNNLVYMAAGMVGIFLVMGVVILLTYTLNKLLSGKSKDE